MPIAHPTQLRDHCLAPERVDAPLSVAGRYGRMFDLPPLEVDEQLLHRIGAAGGFCDGGDHAGDRLGEVGGRIAGEVLVGVTARDPESYLALEPDWEPTLPARESRFKLRDLLALP